MFDLKGALARKAAERQQRANAQDDAARRAWAEIPQLQTNGLQATPRDWVALECLANSQAYSKSDTRKRFVLWEARRTGDVVVTAAPNLHAEHPWVEQLFLPGAGRVRFPFNPGDSSLTDSLSWESISEALRLADGQLRDLPRFSTASRSCLVLIPEQLNDLDAIARAPAVDARQQHQVGTAQYRINTQEWTDLRRALANEADAPQRFSAVVGDIGAAAGTRVAWNGHRYRLYSLKTGVSFVGSHYEGRGSGDKHLLESNSTMAMVRSDAIRVLRNTDNTLGVQTEILTVTAPCRLGRDGFQVRDLSCMLAGHDYLPGQAIPYAGQHFDGGRGVAQSVESWRTKFAIPLGRAKARMLLNYGLIHTSANAQNFVLGFERDQVRQFVLRDLGDTSWHDDYIDTYLGGVGPSIVEALRQERADQVRHLLHATSSGAYPAPHIVRLAANSVLTHGFGENAGWNSGQRHRFVTGIFDGFLSYIEECLGIGAVYPQAQGQLQRSDMIALGDQVCYPHTLDDGVYRRSVEELVRRDPADLLGQAAQVRQLDAQGLTDNQLRALINAEEALLCAAVEALLSRPADARAINNRLRQLFTRGDWPAVVPGR
ncbi:MAG: hypothetical protein AAGC55_15485 [Myxococcota bacterium]